MVATLPAGVALHARPAGVFVRTAMQFQARITVAVGDREADAKSILKVLGLGAQGGTALSLQAEGADADAALAALADCVANLSD
ncbi:MAG: HPr family phosphocarrier protein [Candidatus Dormibacteraeota bacterium]|nr:HPr family phosphocarrier protein [Candidatus Dormibacteraeota bacterium]